MVDLPTLHGPRNSTIGLEVISPSTTARVRNRSELASVLTVGAALLPKAPCTPLSSSCSGFPVDQAGQRSVTFLLYENICSKDTRSILTFSRSLAHLPAPEGRAKQINTYWLSARAGCSLLPKSRDEWVIQRAELHTEKDWILLRRPGTREEGHGRGMHSELHPPSRLCSFPSSPLWLPKSPPQAQIF